MHQGGPLLAIALLSVVAAGPILLGIASYAVSRRQGGAQGWAWGPVLNSAFLYALAFNLTFFVQELFLVVPKALTPGLAPVLYHNNHGWTGDHPLDQLFQGTGALAIVVMAALVALWLRVRPPRAALFRLFLIWMVFHGFLQALPQVPIGMMDPNTDTGRAMTWLAIGPAAGLALSFAALAAIPAVALWLARQMARLGGEAAPVAFLFRTGVVPALIGILLVIPFRVPAAIPAVVLPPVLVGIMGTGWMLAAGWWIGRGRSGGAALPDRLSAWPPVLLVLLLAFFQLVLRPGVAF